MIKVTEVKGYHSAHYEYDWIEVLQGEYVSMSNIIPEEARSNAFDVDGPKGTFKITVEFIPD